MKAQSAWFMVGWLGVVGLVLPAYAQNVRTSTEAATEASSRPNAQAVDVGDHRVLIENLQGELDRFAGRIAVVSDKVALLRETALGGDIGETRAIIVHKNELGDGFVLERVRYLLDGGVLLDELDENGSFASVAERILFDGRLDAGDHKLEVEVVCRGGGFGLFSYVEAYRFRVKSKYVFRVREGRVNRLELVVFQRPDITLQAPERLTVKYNYQVLEQGSEAGEKAP